MTRCLHAWLLIPALAFGAEDGPPPPPAAEAPPVETDSTTLRRFQSDLPPPIYQGPWGPGFGRGVGGCCHETPDGELYCHGIRS